MLKLLVALTVAGSVIPAVSDAHRGCNTRACNKRVDQNWDKKHPMQTGIASIYDAAGGSLACSGRSSYGPVVAHKTLPCGTRVRICFHRCITAIVADRGPFIRGRDWDLSRYVQFKIGFPFGVDRIRFRLIY